ncbi:MAG: hypothetical protein LUG94_00770, partial [Ruminococcus sp.]|nr:hypothetical protein [Ruminococcus sp.]
LSIMDFEKYLIENEDTLSGDIKQLSTLTIAEGNVNQALILSPENIRTTNLLEQLGFKWHSLEKKNLDDIVRFK